MEQRYLFQCVRCHRCCRHQPGYVFLSQQDVTALVAHLGCDEETFTERYTRRVYHGDGVRYSLKERENFDCIFWQDGCTVYPARPQQCRAYPFWARIIESERNWQEERASCPGIGQGVSYSREQAQAIARALAEGTPYAPR